MGEFEKVSIVKQANIYYDGKVTSRTVIFENGEKKTLGIMLPGEYEFGTSNPEIMEILQGNLEVKLPGGEEWFTFSGGESFAVPADSKFSLIVHETTDYCCSYIER
ncbi:MAG: pyrimidine/purine nucleoside phosphorylase [Firmicutes bacterium]|nr:pyrimidine/purine nucleoside phosphorylase [Bacillota bacterium]